MDCLVNQMGDNRKIFVMVAVKLGNEETFCLAIFFVRGDILGSVNDVNEQL